jgi:hypothetical protein
MIALLSVRYKVRALSFTLSGENLGFNKQISIINQSDYFVGMINYRLLQGFVLTGLTYKF